MGDVVNLRAARKRKARAENERQAAENRVLHGQSKVEKKLVRALRDSATARHESHLRDVRPPADEK